MTVILLDRKANVLWIGNSIEDIEKMIDVTLFYGVTHVAYCGSGNWYDIYRRNTILGFITDVETVKEKW